MNNFVIDTPDNFWQIRWLDKYMEGHKGFIAGGCFKNILSGERVKDIDIFFESESDFQEAVDLFNDEKHQKEGWKFKYRNEKVCAFQKEGEKVWLNPPYSRPTIEHFITRMVQHNNGIALLFNRLDNKMFQDVVFPKAKGILFMKGRIKFHREDGTIGESPGCGSILVAFGEENAETLRSSNIEGRYIQVNQEPCNTHVDWEQRRYEMAKTMLPITSVSGRGPHGELILEACDKAAELAVIYADALIKELK